MYADKLEGFTRHFQQNFVSSPRDTPMPLLTVLGRQVQVWRGGPVQGL